MRSSATNLFDLLLVEDDTTILDYRVHKNSIPLWLLVRAYFLRLLVSQLLYKDSPLISAKTAKIPIIRALASLARANTRAISYPADQPVDIMIRSTGAGLQQRDGLLFNRLCDYFVSQKHQTTEVLEDFFEWRFPGKRRFDRVVYNTPFRTSDLLRSKFASCRTDHVTAVAMCDWIRQRCRDILEWDLDNTQYEWFKTLAIQAASSAPIWHSRYQELLDKKKIKLLILEEACYGGWLACLIKAAKDLGIPTAEYQHGLISVGHYAYNYAPSLLKQHKLVECLPEYFLIYGSWWGKQVNVPVKHVVIGNPHRDFYDHKVNRTSTAQRNDVLILGDGRETSKHLRLAAELAKHLRKSDRVVFRPHPEERYKFNESIEKITLAGIYIDRNADIYDSFHHAHTVISEVSTGLFEAIGFVNRILVWETAKSKFGIPNHPFTGFFTVSQAAQLIGDDALLASHAALSETIWASDWKSKYSCFLKEAANL